MSSTFDTARYEVADMTASGPAAVNRAFENQVAYCRDNGAIITAGICDVLRSLLPPGSGGGEVMERVRTWTGPALAGALPLRVAGGLHGSYLAGVAPELEPVYKHGTVQAELIRTALERHETFLLPWLDGPPQTNEAGRSWAYVAALAWLTARGFGPRFALYELGSSAGINLMLERYRYTLGAFERGPIDSAIHIAPEWRGRKLEGKPFDIVSTEGCDVAPVDLKDEDDALRLTAYIWPEFEQRFTRMEAAIRFASEQSPNIARTTAAHYVDRVLAAPAVSGTMRVVMHSVVWQYLDTDEKARIASAIERAGARASSDTPLAWISLEANRDSHRHELSLRYWPGGGEARTLGEAHPHGAWVRWRG